MMSRKKRDTMLSAAASGTNADPASATAPDRRAFISRDTVNNTAAGVHMFLFCPSWRYMVPNNAAYMAYRTATRTYVKGIGEKFSLTPNDASVWYHRRVIVSLKALLSTNIALNDAIGAQSGVNATSYRQFRDLTGQQTGGYQIVWDIIQAQLFTGIKTVDWTDQMTARIDRARFNVHADFKYAIRSGNQASSPKMPSFYTPINKTIQYDDEENGVSITPNAYSVSNKIGLGNIYVIDMFETPEPISATTSTMTIDSTMTYYWHER